MANNVNNGITGVIDIPGALRSRGAADGNLVGGVVAYAGDIYDVTAGKNQATLNAEFAEGITNASSSSFSGNYNDLSDIPLLKTALNGFKVNAHDRKKNTASAQDSFAEGAGTTASGQGSHSEGGGTIASGTSSHAEGSGASAFGDSSHAEGAGTTATGSKSHAEGNQCSSYGSCSHAEGDQADARGDASHAEGQSIKALGKYSHAEGSYTQAKADKSHAEGYNTTAEGENSHAEGSGSQTLGNASHSEGSGSLAEGVASHAEGYNTEAEADKSHAEGELTHAIGKSSHAEGVHTVTTNEAEHASGMYNMSTANKTLFSVGAGHDGGRMNAFEIDTSSNVYIYGVGGYDGTNSTTIGIKSVLGVISDIESNSSSSSSSYTHPSTHPASMITYDASTEYESGNIGYAVKALQTAMAGVPTYSAGTGISISNNTISVDATQLSYNDLANKPDLDSLLTVITDVNTRLSDLEAASSSSSSSPEYISYYAGQGYSIGSTTTASGEHSFAEGLSTNASGNYSHAEGSGYYIHAYVHSAYTAGDTTIILERRVYPGQYLSRRQNERYDAVKVSDVYSHPSNPGIFEVSLEEGFSANLAYHNYVYIFGGALDYGSHAEGEGCTANGSGSHAEGTGTTAFGLGAHSEGDETLAYGGYAHSEGKETLAYGDYSHTEGSETNAREGGHSEGNKTYAYGDYSHAEGHQTLAYGNYSHAEGKGYDKTVTVGSNYVARQTTIDLLSPVTPGQFLAITDNINKYRYAEMELIKILGCQEDTNNLGHYIVTLQYGMNNSVNAGDTLHIYSAASGSYSHSEGNNTSASGDNSHAEGDHTSASGESSHTEGKCTQTTNEAEHACGKYNLSTLNQTLFSIGNGTSSTTRKNAIEVDNNGNVYIKGIGTYDGTNIGQNGVKSVQQVIADLTLQIAALTNN